MSDTPITSAARWWLLECAHHGYGAPDLLMRVRCEVCAKFRRREGVLMADQPTSAADLAHIHVAGRCRHIGDCNEQSTLTYRQEALKVWELIHP